VGESVSGGFVHAPLYDSAMFISSLVIIPSLASFVAKLETDFFERYQRYYGSIKSHGTIGQIEDARRRLAAHTLDTLVLITIAQVGMCAVLIMTAPLLVSSLNLQFRQISILRFGGLAAVFHFIFIATTSFLLFFDRRLIYLALQTLFLVLNLSLSILTLWLGQEYYGAGYFVACLVSSLLAYVMVVLTFQDLNFLTFIGNNPSIIPSAAHARRGWFR
jgi:polysaccharide biosynthesis protein PelG